MSKTWAGVSTARAVLDFNPFLPENSNFENKNKNEKLLLGCNVSSFRFHRIHEYALHE